MNFVLLGGAAFIFFFIFDVNKIKMKILLLNGTFALGAGLLIYSSFMLIQSTSRDFDVSYGWLLVFSLLSLVSGLFMLFALFGALPFFKTYVKVEDNHVIDTGLYALCRHPGVWGFFLMYLFAFLASGRWLVLWACLLWTGLDVIHVWIQDVYFFPKMLVGYQKYQLSTPFLIFNLSSIQRCIYTFGK